MKPDSKYTSKDIGRIGEDIAEKYLIGKGFKIKERNYWRKWGELDLIAENSNVVHFVEVKTVSYETKPALQWAVAHETWRPEEQVHAFKLKKMHRTVESWLSDHNYDGEWQIDVLAIRIVPRETYATVKFIDNVV